MSFYHGKGSRVWLGAYDISTYLNAADVSVDVETADTTTFLSSWKSAIPGEAAATAELGGYYDTAYTDAKASLTAQTGEVLTVVPGGSSAARLFKVLKTAYKESAPIGGAVAFNLGVLADGTASFGDVLKTPAAAITATANTSSVDGGAQSTTGAVAHLHVFSVSTDDSLTVTIEDSANNSTWATIGTFAAATGATSERLVINGTVRRYVRAVLTVSGSGVSITAGLAFART